MAKFEDLIFEIGDFGTYQKRLALAVVLVVIPASINTYMPIFILTIPSHRCALDNLPNDTYDAQSQYHADLINATIPLEDGKQSKCKILRPEKQHKECSFDIVEDGPYPKCHNMTEVNCDKWVYDHEYFDRSVIEELDLVCYDQIWRTHANMAMMVGKLVSALIQGFCSDRFGRRVSLLLFIVILIANSFANAFIYNIPTLIVFRFFAGLATTSCYLNCFVITLEFISNKYRQTYNVVISTMWVLGGFILTGVAYELRDYQDLMLACAAPTVLLLSYFIFIPETPRWLISKGRIGEARKLLEKVARVNGKKFPESTFEDMVKEIQQEEEMLKGLKIKEKAEKDQRGNKELEEEKKERPETMFQMMRHTVLAVRFIIVLWNWIANSMTYYGTLFNVQNLSGSIYLNFALTSLVDLTGVVVMYFLVDRYGRRKMYAAFLFGATLSCLAAIVPPFVATEDESNTINTVLSLMGRAAIGTSFNILYLYTAEMFPTTMRNSAMGASSMFSRIGSISAPYIADLGLMIGGQFGPALPLLAFGGVGFLAVISALFLPETTGENMPDTIQQALELGRKPTDSDTDMKTRFEPEFVQVGDTQETTSPPKPDTTATSKI